jgi:hypothetical protein
VLVVASALLSLRGNTGLEVVLGLAVLKLLSLVQLAGLKLKVLLHHIKIVLIVLFVHTRVAPYQNAVLMKALRYQAALFLGFGGIGRALEEGINIDDWYFS